MIFCNGLYFALRSGREHRQLRLCPCQIELVEHGTEKPYLKYTEDVSKNRPGGIKGRNVKPKIVYHHANTSNPEWCFVRLFKKYIQLCPDSPSELNAFYLQPLKNPTAHCWYSCKTLEHNTVAKCTGKGFQDKSFFKSIDESGTGVSHTPIYTHTHLNGTSIMKDPSTKNPVPKPDEFVLKALHVTF